MNIYNIRHIRHHDFGCQFCQARSACDSDASTTGSVDERSDFNGWSATGLQKYQKQTDRFLRVRPAPFPQPLASMKLRTAKPLGTARQRPGPGNAGELHG